MLTLFLFVLITLPLMDRLCFEELFVPVITAATTCLSCSDNTAVISGLCHDGLDSTPLIRLSLVNLVLMVLVTFLVTHYLRQYPSPSL